MCEQKSQRYGGGTNWKWFLFVIPVLMLGCGDCQTVRKAIALDAAVNEHYEEYLRATSFAERELALLEIVNAYEGAGLSHQSESVGKSIVFTHLFALCVREGRDQRAEVYFIMSRYWYVQYQCASGLDIDAAGDAAMHWTRERCLEIAESMDIRAMEKLPD